MQPMSLSVTLAAIARGARAAATLLAPIASALTLAADTRMLAAGWVLMNKWIAVVVILVLASLADVTRAEFEYEGGVGLALHGGETDAAPVFSARVSQRHYMRPSLAAGVSLEYEWRSSGGWWSGSDHSHVFDLALGVRSLNPNAAASGFLEAALGVAAIRGTDSEEDLFLGVGWGVIWNSESDASFSLSMRPRVYLRDGLLTVPVVASFSGSF